VAENPDPAMQTTLLVNEAYLRLVGGGNVGWDNRRHFFAAAAEAMRRIRIDEARKRRCAKRGGGRRRVGLDETLATGRADPLDLLAIDEALSALEAENARPAEVVKLRFFAGLGVEDTAAALGVSPRTVELDWRYARAWLHKALRGT
jgi:RNA polymerase sigma factor (TIGR02999 family)